MDRENAKAYIKDLTLAEKRQLLELLKDLEQTHPLSRIPPESACKDG